jgi:hypothetical protein
MGSRKIAADRGEKPREQNGSPDKLGKAGRMRAIAENSRHRRDNSKYRTKLKVGSNPYRLADNVLTAIIIQCRLDRRLMLTGRNLTAGTTITTVRWPGNTPCS